MGKAGEHCGFISKIHWGVLCGKRPNTLGHDKEATGNADWTLHQVGTAPLHCSIPALSCAWHSDIFWPISGWDYTLVELLDCDVSSLPYSWPALNSNSTSCSSNSVFIDLQYIALEGGKFYFHFTRRGVSWLRDWSHTHIVTGRGLKLKSWKSKYDHLD